MTEHFLGPRRSVPLHAPVVQDDAGENTQENKDIQQDAGAGGDVQVTSLSSVEDYTISVDHVRTRLKTKGLSKSKDTVQRWCRTGDLDCQKRGVLGRYFTTEASLLALEQKLLPDMIAEGVEQTSAARANLPVHEPAFDHTIQAHEEAPVAETADVQQHDAEDTGARGIMQVDAPGDAGAGSSGQVAALRAQVEGLTQQLEQAQEMNTFLREEIVSSRGQRGDVVKIAEQMLGTLETIAVGGRLERPVGKSDVTPVRYSQPEGDAGAV